jgi:hypothetical protein
VTKPTSSPSAGTTTSTDGQPATDPNSDPTFAAAVEAIEGYTGARVEIASGWELRRFFIEYRIRRIVHRMGFHWPADAEHWDPENGSVQYVGRRCFICDAVC